MYFCYATGKFVHGVRDLYYKCYLFKKRFSARNDNLKIMKNLHNL